MSAPSGSFSEAVWLIIGGTAGAVVVAAKKRIGRLADRPDAYEMMSGMLADLRGEMQLLRTELDSARTENGKLRTDIARLETELAVLKIQNDGGDTDGCK